MPLSNLRVPETSQIRALEAKWIEDNTQTSGINWGQILMEMAGKAAAHCALSLWNLNPGHVAIFAGAGNNGGDGLVLARYLNLWGVPASVFLLGEEMTSAESKANRKIFEGIDGEIVVLSEQSPEDLEETLGGITGSASILVDAIFGTGLKRPVQGLERKVIEAINNSAKPVLAVDIPSGINSDNGQIMGVAVRADQTCTFGYLKGGLLNYPGAQYAGDISLVDIGLPDFAEPALDIAQSKDYDASRAHYLTTCGAVQNILPRRPTNANKGTHGSLLTIAGSLGMSGAAVLAATSAMRSGAGLTMLAMPRSLVAALPPCELVVKPLDETSAQSLSSEALPALLKLVEQCKAVVIGCGLSQNQDTINLVLSLIEQIDKPCLVDADALNAVAQNKDKLRGGNFILTPHPKELSRLIDMSVEEILADRASAVRKAARMYEAIVVLKGAHTMVASPEGELYYNPTGNGAMATAGAGDVLSGIAGGLLAQGLSPLDAAVAAVYLHGRAGELALTSDGHNAQSGEVGTISYKGLSQVLTAGQISEHIQAALGSVHAGELSYLEQRVALSVAAI